MDRTTLSEQDINILIEAMETWEKKNTTAGFGGALLGAMLVGPDRSSEDRKSAMQREIDQARDEDRRNAEVSILIKAKLIHMKRESQSRADMAEGPVGRYDR